MASIKNLKKDVQFLTNELASECLFKMFLYPDIAEESINAVALEGVTLRNELLARANHSDGKGNAKLVKAYFKKLNADVLDGYSKLFEKLTALK